MVQPARACLRYLPPHPCRLTSPFLRRRRLCAHHRMKRLNLVIFSLCRAFRVSSSRARAQLDASYDALGRTSTAGTAAPLALTSRAGDMLVRYPPAGPNFARSSSPLVTTVKDYVLAFTRKPAPTLRKLWPASDAAPAAPA